VLTCFTYNTSYLFSILDLSTVKKEYDTHSSMQLDQSACGKFYYKPFNQCHHSRDNYHFN